MGILPDVLDVPPLGITRSVEAEQTTEHLKITALAMLFVASGCHREIVDAGRAATPPAVAANVPAIDELGYFEQLKARRPDLMTSDACYASLVLKPRYRQSLLDGGETFDSLQRATYTATQDAADRAWVKALQDSELAYCKDNDNPGNCASVCRQACAACPDEGMTSGHTTGSFSVWPAGYPLCWFVGYFIGPQSHMPYDPSGKVRSWKVFFEFKEDFTDKLTPATYLQFSKALAEAGFNGDSKIPLGAGRARYQYNDVIVHAHSPADAKIAEKVGLAQFGSTLAGHARGLDVASTKAPASAGGELDWHHYLCAEGIAGLSDEALRFVGFKD